MDSDGKKIGISLLVLVCICVREIVGEHQGACPKYCTCDFSRSKSNGGEWSRVRCGGEEYPDFEVSKLQLGPVAAHIAVLELSSSGITELQPSFLDLHRLQRLDLSRNKISNINIDAFKNLTGLKRLDLSFNMITTIQKEVFQYLPVLEKLKLNHNLLIRIEVGAFNTLPFLKQLDISENPLKCDCEIAWLVTWIRNSSLKLLQAPRCEAPAELQGQLLKKLKLHCHDKPSGESQLEIKPTHDQIVFEGDSLNLRCRSLTVGSIGGESRDAQVLWSWKDKDPSSYFEEIKVESKSFEDRGFVESLLTIEHIERSHAGDWYCHLVSEQGNHSSVISVIVISDDTKYCPQTVTRNNKGAYIWPRTVVGFVVDLPCEGEQVGPVGDMLELRASYECNFTGHWDYLNTSQCPYISETTKILEQFSRVNLSIAKGSVLESAKRLRNFTEDGKVLTDVMDVVFISRTIENYLTFVKGEKELGPVLIDIVSSVTKLPLALLRAAQTLASACSNMISSVEVIAKDTPTLQAHKSNLAVEEFGVAKDKFQGITCIWFTNAHSEGNGKFFHCSTSNKTGLVGTSDKIIEASIQVPATLFYQLEMNGRSTQSVSQLILAMYEDSSLFPVNPGSGRDVASCIVGARLVGVEVNNLTDPVYVMLKAPAFNRASSPRPVWWDSRLNNGSGNWSTDGCRLSHFHHHGLLVFQCDRFGYFGLLQDTALLGDSRYVGSKARLCHPAVYSGTFVLLLCLLITSATYLVSHSVIQMPRRAKHSIVNTWVALALLCFMFSSGIYQTEELKVCQGVGLVLHYLSLSVLLWMSVTANSMYKRLSKPDTLDNPVEDELPPGMPVQKPILGLYLVGWGIGLIVCGISGAVNLREYAGTNFCFLCSGPSLSAMFVPAGMLVVFLLALYSLTLCAIRNNDMNGQLSEGTQGTENVDLELLEVPVGNGCVERRSLQSIITGDSDEVEDPEHSPMIQLKAHLIVLVLYVLTWAAAALAVTDTFTVYTPYQEDIFSIAFCFLAFFLGAFVLYFYGVARSDVRSEWVKVVRAMQGEPGCCRPRGVSDTQGNVQVQVVQVANSTVVVSNGNHHTHALPALSSSSMNSSSRQSNRSNRSKAVRKLNNCDEKEEPLVLHSKLTNNVNLIAMHRQMYRSNNSMPTYHEISGPDCAEAFYNPHQSIVARKFFKKQRRNKRNDLGLRRRGDGGGTSDGEVSQARRTWRPSAESAVFLSSDMENVSEKVGPALFAYGSKVNNTNIHVGQSSQHKKNHPTKNPNILTESDTDDVPSQLPIERLVIGAEEETASPGKMSSSCRSLSRVSEEVNSTAVNMSEHSELQRARNSKDDLTDDDLVAEVALATPDYRTVELQCSLGENSCSDLNSEMNYCNDECCGDGDCPVDCCSKLTPTNEEELDELKAPSQVDADAEVNCDSFNEKIDSLCLSSVQAPLSPEKGPKNSPPQYVTVMDPQYGLVKVTLGEYKEFAHKLSLAPVFDDEDEETLMDKSSDSDKGKKETSV